MPTQQQHERTIARHVKGSPGALYDLGVGPKSEWRTLGAIWPDIRVFGCEPCPATYKSLIEAGFPGPLAQVALGETEGMATLRVPSGDLKCCSLLPIPYADSTAEVKVWTLDRFDREMGRPDHILLWMDIEGMELAALRGGQSLMESGRVRWINLEERENGHRPAEGWCDPRELQAHLESLGYRRVRAYNSHGTHKDAIYVREGEA